jgi:hypothetical protein
VQDVPEVKHTPEDIAAFDNLCRRAAGKPALTLVTVEVEQREPQEPSPPEPVYIPDSLVEPDYFGEMENLFDADEIAEAEAIRAEAVEIKREVLEQVVSNMAASSSKNSRSVLRLVSSDEPPEHEM